MTWLELVVLAGGAGVMIATVVLTALWTQCELREMNGTAESEPGADPAARRGD